MGGPMSPLSTLSLFEGRCSLPHAVPVVREIDRFSEPFVVLLCFRNSPLFILKKSNDEEMIRARARIVVLRVLRVLRVLQSRNARKINPLKHHGKKLCSGEEM